MDSDSDSEDDRPLVPTPGPEVFAMSEREDSMEDDPTTGVGQPLSTVVGGRRLVLLPQSSGGTPRSVCDRSSADEGTVPFRGQPVVRSPAVSHNRFAPLDSQEAADAVDHPSQREESDTESVVSLSGSVGPDLVDAAQEVIPVEPQLAEFRISEALRDALVSLDDVNVETEFRRRANLMRSPPKFLEGASCNGRSSRGSTHQQ